MLSVVLTVHNAEKTLAEHVTRMLDVLPDLASRFELLIVDDGSTDQTEEVAHELAVSYPQLSVARHPRRLGSNAAAQTALANTSGDLVILHEASADTANEPRRIAEFRRSRPLPLVATSDPLRLLQDPSLRTTSPREPGGDVERTTSIVPRRTDRPSSPARIAATKSGSPDHASRALPRILARIMAHRTPIDTPDVPVV
jgi:hypothetical protein